jgi:hypothetical protein
MINLDSKKNQLKMKLQLITLLSDPSIKIREFCLDNQLDSIPSIDGWKNYKRSPIIDLSLKLVRYTEKK